MHLCVARTLQAHPVRCFPLATVIEALSFLPYTLPPFLDKRGQKHTEHARQMSQDGPCVANHGLFAALNGRHLT